MGVCRSKQCDSYEQHVSGDDDELGDCLQLACRLASLGRIVGGVDNVDERLSIGEEVRRHGNRDILDILIALYQVQHYTNLDRIRFCTNKTYTHRYQYKARTNNAQVVFSASIVACSTAICSSLLVFSCSSARSEAFSASSCSMRLALASLDFSAATSFLSSRVR